MRTAQERRRQAVRDVIYRVTPYNLDVADALARDILNALDGLGEEGTARGNCATHGDAEVTTVDEREPRRIPACACDTEPYR